MKRKDIVSGVVLIVIGLLVAQQAAQLTYRDEFGPGPGMLPYWLGLIMCGLAVIQVGLALRRRDDAIPTARSDKGRVLPAAAGLIVMAAAVEVIGFMPSFGLLSFFLVYAVERQSFGRAATTALAMVLGFVLLFRLILPIPLP
jgi:hypothetical protein